jgi:hypothetical protein
LHLLSVAFATALPPQIGVRSFPACPSGDESQGYEAAPDLSGFENVPQAIKMVLKLHS